MSGRAVVQIDYFTDVLCIWAYGAQIRVDELVRNFGAQVKVDYRYVPLFGDTQSRVGEGWRDRGGFQGFNRHVRDAAEPWDYVDVHPEVWLRNVPASCSPAHIFLKAVQCLESEDVGVKTPESPRPFSEQAAWRLRERFFKYAEDVAARQVHEDVARSLGLPLDRLWDLIDSGKAHAAAHRDVQAKEQYQVPGSPCFVLNEGRQRLYGNLGYGIIEANVLQLLKDSRYGEASWC